MKDRLYRSRREKMIGGVAGGIAEYFEIDPVLVRISFVAAVFIQGIGLIAYILLWIIVPERPIVPASVPNMPEGETTAAYETPVQAASKSKTGSVVGIILIVLGGLFLLDNIFPFFDFDNFWPLLLVGLGIALLIKSSNKN